MTQTLFKGRKGLQRHARAIGGAIAACIILLACLVILSRLTDLEQVQSTTLSNQVYSAVFSLMFVIYLTSFLLWKNFARVNGLNRSDREGIIDMGLITLGKYLPGKVWGILARGTVNSTDIGLKKHSIAVSASEQVITLVVGILFVLSLSVLIKMQVSACMALFTAIACTTLLVAVFYRVCLWIPVRFTHFFMKLLEFKPYGFLVIPCYCFLWIVSATPIVVIANQFYELTSIESLSLATAFLSAMIFGWIAIFAPGGIGVRETVFLWLSPTVLSWEQSLYMVTLHRSLSLVFDLTLGLLCCSFIWIKTFRVSVK